MNLADTMRDSGLLPTQKEVYAENINEYAEAMRTGVWDWKITATDARAFMIVDANGGIIAGHHRFVAAKIADISIPNGVVKMLIRPSARGSRAWTVVTVRPGYRP